MTNEYTPEEIKRRLSNIGEAIGEIALKYIFELEKENAKLKQEKIPQLERKIANQDMTDKEMTEEMHRQQKQDDELKEFTEEFEKEVEREKARVLRNLDKYWR